MTRHSTPTGGDTTDHDERLGEAIEAYLAAAEAGAPPDPESFAAGYPGLESDLLAALEGLALVNGLVGGPGRLESGRRIAGYRIVRELGRGGMGVVYEAVHVGLDRPVALKVLGSHAAPDSSGRRRFLNEARTAAGLHHTHIVPVFDVGQVGGLCYFAMQRIEGSGLDRVLRHLRRGRATAAGGSNAGGSGLRLARLSLRLSPGFGSGASTKPRGSESATGPWAGRDDGLGLSGTGSLAGQSLGLGTGPSPRGRDDEPPPFDPPRGSGYYRWVAEVGRQAAEAVGHAHRHGVIHRDLKPSNLLVDGSGLVWVADFGLARRLADPSQTQHDSLLGTPRYMSPEQARIGPIDGRSDLFSLGATLYELLTLRPPFDGRSAAELIEQIGTREPANLRLSDPRIPRDLETIVLKLLSKRPADRYATAADLAEDLTRFLNYEPVHARRISPFGRMWRFARRHPSLTAVSTAAALTVLAVTTVAYVKILHERDQANLARGETQAAMRKLLLQQASYVRRDSHVPNRRATGMGYIKEAAALRPEPALRAQLQHEAVELLALRDVEPREPFATGKSRALAFGPAGTHLAVLSGDGGDVLSVWDVASRKRIAENRLRPEPPAGDSRGPGPGGTAPRRGGGGGGANGGGGGGGGFRPLFSPLAAAGPCVAVLAPNGHGVRLFDMANGLHVGDLPMPGRQIVGMLAAPDGHRLVTVERIGPLRGERPLGPAAKGAGPPPQERYVVDLWDTGRTDKPLATLAQFDSEPGQPGSPPPLIAISPDGKSAAVARFRKTTVSIYSTETGEAIGPGAGIDTTNELTTFALGTDNQLAVAVSGEIRLWDTASGAALPSLTPNQSGVRFLRFSPRGSLLAVVGYGKEMELWDTSAHTLVSTLPTPDRVEDLAFSPDGQTIATAGQGATTSVWAVVDPVARTRIGGFDAVTFSLAFRDDGLLAMGTYNRQPRFWAAGRCRQGDEHSDEDAAAPRDRPSAFAFDAQGRLITALADGLRICDGPPQCARGESIPYPAPRPFNFAAAVPSAIAATRDGRTIAVTRGTEVLLWSPDAPDAMSEVDLPLDPGGRPGGGMGPGRGGRNMGWRGLAIAPDGRRLYLIDARGRLQAFALDGLKAKPLPWTEAPAEASSLAISPDGTRLAVGDNSGFVTLIDAATGKVAGRLDSPARPTDGRVWSLAYARDGRTLAVGTQQGAILLWSTTDPTAPALRLPSQRNVISALAFDPQGRYLAAACFDKTVDLWDLARVRDEFHRLDLDW